VDVAEVEDVRRVHRVRERQLDRVRRLRPVALADEELGLVGVQAEVLAARRRRSRVVVARGAGEGAVLVVHRGLARVVGGAGAARLRDAGLELVDVLVRAVHEVGEAQRVVPVAVVALVEVVRDAPVHHDDGVRDVAALGVLEVARRAREGVDRGGERALGGRGAVRRHAGVGVGARARAGVARQLARRRRLGGDAEVRRRELAAHRAGADRAGGLALTVQPALHELDLHALVVDDRPQDVHDLAVGGERRLLLHQQLGHVDGVVVVRDHLVHEGRGVVRIQGRLHVVVHGAVHRVEALAEAAGRERAHAAAEEVLGHALLGAARGVVLQTVRATRRVVGRGRLVVVRGDRLIGSGAGRRNDGARGIGDLDVAAHAAVDVAEVEDVFGVRRVRERERHGVLRRQPVLLPNKELGLVGVQAEVAVVARGGVRAGACEDAVLVVHRGLARVGARATVTRLRNGRLQLVDVLVGAVDEVGPAERVVPVRVIRLVEDIPRVLLHRDDGVGDVAALVELEVSRRAHEGVDRGRVHEGLGVVLGPVFVVGAGRARLLHVTTALAEAAAAV